MKKREGNFATTAKKGIHYAIFAAPLRDCKSEGGEVRAAEISELQVTEAPGNRNGSFSGQVRMLPPETDMT